MPKINDDIFIKFFLIASVLLFLFFGLIHLTKFVTADEHYWSYERVPQYWKALKEHNFKKTLINDKPGVTLALVSGTGLLSTANPLTHKIEATGKLDIYNWKDTENMYFNFRLPILLFNFALLFYFYWIIRKITANKWLALWSTMLIALSPILIGISQILNPDALFWSLGSACLFSYFALLKTNEKKFIFLTAIFLGLSIITKYVANIFLPLLLLSLFSFPLLTFKKEAFEQFNVFLKNQLKYFFFLLILSLIVIATFLPAVLVKPIYLYRLTLGFQEKAPLIYLSMFIFYSFLTLDTFLLKNRISLKIKHILNKYSTLPTLISIFILIIFATLILGRNIFPNWELFEKVSYDLKNLGSIDLTGIKPSLSNLVLLEFNPLVFSLTPVALFFFIAQLILQFKKKNHQFIFFTFIISFFIAAYFIASILTSTLATIRYSIIIYPLIAFIAAIGIWNFQKINVLSKMKFAKHFLTIFIFSCSTFSIVSIKPFYFNYNSFLLPAQNSITSAWGYGGYEAAQYINSLPQADNLTIWSDYYGVCEFVKSKCITSYKFDNSQYKIDYYVLTQRGEKRYDPTYPLWKTDRLMTVQAYPYYYKKNPVWDLYINNKKTNYIKIFKSE